MDAGSACDAAPGPPAIVDWRERALALLWDPDDLVPVDEALVPPRHTVRIYHWSKAKQAEKNNPGPFDERHVPPYVTDVEADQITVCNAYGRAVYFGVTLPYWARAAERCGWVSPVPDTIDPEIETIRRWHNHWETVTVAADRITFTEPGGESRSFVRGSVVPPGTIAREQFVTAATDAPSVAPGHPNAACHDAQRRALWRLLWARIARWRATGEPMTLPRVPEHRPEQSPVAPQPQPDLPEHPAIHGSPIEPIPAAPKPPSVPAEQPSWHDDVAWDDDCPADAPDAMPRTGIVVYTDGSGTGSVDEPGHAAIGVVAFRDGVPVCEVSEYIGPGTNNIAEVRALGRALAVAFALAERSRAVHLVIYTDSQFARGAVRPGSRWSITKNPALATLVAAVRAETERWPGLDIRHIRGHADTPESHRPGNHRADYLAGSAVDRHRVRGGEDIRRRTVVELDETGRIVARPGERGCRDERGGRNAHATNNAEPETDCQPPPYARKLAHPTDLEYGPRPMASAATTVLPPMTDDDPWPATPTWCQRS